MKELLNTLMEKSVVSSPLKMVSPLSGGSISNVSLVTLENNQQIIVKAVPNSEMLKAEALGLKLLNKALIPPSPKVLFFNNDYLVLEYIKTSTPNKKSWFDLGVNLAKMHRDNTDALFGLEHNNFIGSTIQRNTNRTSSWSEFFLYERLLFQIELALKKGAPQSLSVLFDSKKSIIESHLHKAKCSPSLLHGDLWSGNALFDQHGLGYIIDPAIYYGAPEADLAMTELFGGFDREFYRGYESITKFSRDYSTLKDIYNLYHILNHYNLFGGSYLNQAISILQTC